MWYQENIEIDWATDQLVAAGLLDRSPNDTFALTDAGFDLSQHILSRIPIEHRLLIMLYHWCSYKEGEHGQDNKG